MSSRAPYRATVIVQSTESSDALATRFLQGVGSPAEKVTVRRLSPALLSLRAEINVPTLALAQGLFSAGLEALDSKTARPRLQQWRESFRMYRTMPLDEES